MGQKSSYLIQLLRLFKADGYTIKQISDAIKINKNKLYNLSKLKEINDETFYLILLRLQENFPEEFQKNCKLLEQFNTFKEDIDDVKR